MNSTTKIGLGLLIFALWPKPKPKAKATIHLRKQAPKASDDDERPEASKTPAPREVEPVEQLPPGPEESTDEDAPARIRERARLAQEQAAKKAAKKHRKAGPRTEEEETKQNEIAAELASRMRKKYLDDGEEPAQATADALALYLLAGGSDPDVIRGTQHQLGLAESGVYDMATSQKINTMLDAGVDTAILAYLEQIRKGEGPPQAAAVALATYEEERATNPSEIVIPRERLAALQIQFMVPSGEYDEATKNALVAHGITPP